MILPCELGGGLIRLGDGGKKKDGGAVSFVINAALGGTWVIFVGTR